LATLVLIHAHYLQVSPLLIHPCFVSVFRLMWVSSLTYPNLLGTKRFGCCWFSVIMNILISNILLFFFAYFLAWRVPSFLSLHRYCIMFLLSFFIVLLLIGYFTLSSVPLYLRCFLYD
jgi:hypothetical protein